MAKKRSLSFHRDLGVSSRVFYVILEEKDSSKCEICRKSFSTFLFPVSSNLNGSIFGIFGFGGFEMDLRLSIN
jgi:hypothetical protein